MHNIATYCGCLPCLVYGRKDMHAQVHHVVEGGKRVGHDCTIGLCPWHHVAMPWDGVGEPEMERRFGPSLAHGMTPYERRYGPERYLVEVQDYMLRLFAADPWQEYNVSRTAAKQVHAFWQTNRPT